MLCINPSDWISTAVCSWPASARSRLLHGAPLFGAQQILAAAVSANALARARM
jgi:hypothetical protein